MDDSAGGTLTWSSVLVHILLLNVFIGQGSSIYFSQREVSLTRTFLPDSGFLYVVKGIPERGEDGQVQYSISSGSVLLPKNKKSNGWANNGTTKTSEDAYTCWELLIDKNLGNISVSLAGTPQETSNDLSVGKGGAQQLGVDCVYTVTAKLEGRPGESASPNMIVYVAETKLTLKASPTLSLLPTNTKLGNCKSLSKKELCFGGADRLDLRVMENAPTMPLLYLGGSLPGICGALKVSYNVSTPQGVLSAARAQPQQLLNVLQSVENLDRETIDRYNMSVNCIIEHPEDPTRVEVIGIAGALEVLDENDNVVAWTDQFNQTEITTSISLASHKYNIKHGARIMPDNHNELLAQDLDTMDVNNLRIHTINDTKELLEFSLLQHEIPMNKIMQTAVIVRVVFSKTAANLQPWTDYYCVQAVINDSTVIPSKRGQDLKCTVCVSWGQEPQTPRPSPSLPPVDELLKLLSRQVMEASLPRNAQRFAPVLYPFPDLVEDWSDIMPGVEFTLTHLQVNETTYVDTNSFNEEDLVIGSGDYNGNVFNVTPKMGIIHLLHPEILRSLPFNVFHLQLHINFADSTIRSFSRNITITLQDGVVHNDTSCEDESCASHLDANSCELACGYGSRGNCVWSQESGLQNSLINDDDGGAEEPSHNAPGYSTCTPYKETCPDGKCDEMEQLFPHLCPQDCATRINGFPQKLLKHSNGKVHGIDGKYCKGVGSCQDHETCSCGAIPTPIVDSSTSHEHRPTGGKLSTPVNTECGSECVMMYLAVTVAIVALLIISIYMWRARVERERKSRSHNQSVMMTSNGIELAYGDNTGHGTLISDVDYMARGLGHMSDEQFALHILQVDSKWEIARDDLLLEHILGEGQFGRVLKGRLHGHSGHMPVAVKMLKVDTIEGSKSLWQEFMAEFSLLKQVDHPNVIKLLGACTTTGGPPYLVMEYAEYGALRSFLRKCRRVEKINGSQPALQWENGECALSGGCEPTDLDYIVTPREVLGFSWQIAKGMAYLSDMKMVHRDLAARNILLTKNKMCKISDFGLTRDIYVDDAYQKKSKDRVPVKWLAPECLADELYTTKSDVWAYGILVWELTTLGASPYPGIQSEQLYSLLNSGYRMPQPHNCSNELFALMRRCWAYAPSNRPTFHQIVLELSKMLEDGIEYLKLDVPSVSNPGYDYFSQSSEHTGSEMVNLSPTNISPLTEARPLCRRKLSMENLRLIDYEISTDGEFLMSKRSGSDSQGSSCTKHTYINEPKQACEQDCSTSSAAKPSVVSSSGYESPIRSATSVAV